MNLYTRARKHIDMSRVKSMREEKNQKKLLQEYNKRKELAKLRDKHSPEFSNWRGNVAEGMNTGNVFFTTLPATGDTDLETISTEVSSSFEDAGGNDAFENTTVRGSGTGSGSDGGFNIGNHLAFQGDGQPRWAILKPIDSSKFDTLTISAIRGNDTNGGEDPDATGEELRLYYLPPGGSAFRSIGVNPEGQTVQPADFDVIIPLGSDNSGLRDYEIKLPSYARGVAFRYMLYQLTNSGTGFDNYGIKNVRYQRKAPLSVFVPLDSPEAASFINDGSGGLSPEEKKKRLEDMLAASDEYQSRQFPFNKAAYEQAAKDVARNIQISLDPSTFDVPTYGSPTYNQMFNPRMDANSGIEQIKNSLESKGLSLDNLKKNFNKQRGVFDSLGYDGTLTLLNNPDTQEQTLTAMGIDLGLVTNYTPDSWDKISKITNLRPGGTPVTGWDGKFYRYDDPQLEASQIIPLETYLKVRGTDNFAGIEKPDRAEPYSRYVMKKKYTFSQDSEARPVYTSVRNEDIDDMYPINFVAKAIGGLGTLGHSYDYGRYKNESGNSKTFYLRGLVKEATATLNYIARNAEGLAFKFLYSMNRYSGIYVDRIEKYKDTDLSTEYNPLWMWDDPKNQDMLNILRGLVPSSLEYDISYHTNNADSEESKQRQHAAHLRENDRLLANLQKSLELVESITSIDPFVKDEWYLRKNQDARTVTEIRTTHPYSGLPEPEPTPEEPTLEEPEVPTEEPEKDLTDVSKVLPKASDNVPGNEVADEVGKVADYYKDKKITNPEIQTPNLLRSLTNFFTGADDSLLGDVVPPAYEYAADIAASILAGRPVNLTKNDVTTRDLELMFNQLSPNEVGVFSKPEAYADDNIRELPNGNVVVNTTGRNNTRAIYKPPTVTVGGQQIPTDFGYSNPIGAAGQAQVQLIVPSNNPRDAYFRYTDHAYYNDKSTDPGELPLGNFDPRGWVGSLINSVSKTVYPNGLKGYSSNIRGDRTLKFDVPYDELPQNYKDKVNTEIDHRSIGGGSLGDTLQGTGAGDAASAAADTQRKKKKNVKEMYEPKAKHNDKVAKVTGRLKSVSDFLNHPDVKPVFPKDPPPEMINGRHPDLVDGEKVSNRFNRLDPISAKAMPKTGNPKIDAKVAKALKKPK